MKYSNQPYLPALGFDPYHALDDVRNHFGCLRQDVSPSINFLFQKTLANITFHDNELSSISINVHQILNWPTLPKIVIEYIFHHELLHLIVPKREIDGVLKSHPPEFLDLQKTTFPDADIVTRYIMHCLFPMIKNDKKAEQIKVLPNWRECTAERFIPIEEFCELNGTCITGNVLDVDGGLVGRTYYKLGLEYNRPVYVS